MKRKFALPTDRESARCKHCGVVFSHIISEAGAHCGAVEARGALTGVRSDHLSLDRQRSAEHWYHFSLSLTTGFSSSHPRCRGRYDYTWWYCHKIQTQGTNDKTHFYHPNIFIFMQHASTRNSTNLTKYKLSTNSLCHCSRSLSLLIKSGVHKKAM